MCAKDLAILLINDELDKARIIAESERLTIRLEGEASDLDVVAAFLCLRFGETKRCDLWLGIRCTQHHLVIERDRLCAGNIFRSDEAHCRAYVRQHQFACYVADGINIWNTGLHLVIDFDHAALTDLDTNIFESESF